MSNKRLSLAARYRPQTFADVAGQDMVKAVLSRACAEDRPACAYLFSGTRGVGKTTIARIFAKALNCATAPTSEPCNQCPQCQKIMQGNHVDVIEIDGASNNKVEDIRALRETVGYAPMEGRYKVFIIDEAHMLTTSAFNALLKTLEEPPPRVIFVMATTEAHKFPVTIVSRCQHFTFRHLREEELVAHVKKILEKESLRYEEDAVTLIAKRAQGSVRDSMSLLDQTLALCDDTLQTAITREVLGLAGQEFFESLFAAMVAADCAQVVTVTQDLLRRGVDIGFFLKELAGYFRNLFLVSHSGESMADVLQLTPGEKRLILGLQGRLSVAHVHAAWQLVLDSQRTVVLSTEPASALELLLLNLTLLPYLLPVAGGSVPPPQAQGQMPPPRPVPQAQGQMPPPRSVPQSQEPIAPQRPVPQSPPPRPVPQSQEPVPPPQRPVPQNQGQRQIAPKPAKEQTGSSSAWQNEVESDDDEGEDGDFETVVERVLDWQGFCTFYAEQMVPNGGCSFSEKELRSLRVESFGTHVRIYSVSGVHYDRLTHARDCLAEGLGRFTRIKNLDLSIVPAEQTPSDAELMASVKNDAQLRPFFDLLECVVEDCRKR
ncbi:MAG: DNA polymerase III subunit gamma/tau [Desulfovibrio sp.]|nr:DNA polymerase III subunit gamma/tau [Desulfovibrio sp.]